MLIIANWKCNPSSLKEARHLFQAIGQGLSRQRALLKAREKTEIVLCPPFVYLAQGRDRFYQLGAQDCHWEISGAYTGQISPFMLKDIGCRYVIIGHSERRRFFKESSQLINQKMKAALKARLKPILCLGEEVRDSFNSAGQVLNEMSLKVAEQLEEALVDLPQSRLAEIVIAYEPVWAIGTGNPCPPEEAMKAGLFIKKTLVKLAGRSLAERVRILYGGSVKSSNAAVYIKEARLDGLLVGQASLNASEFLKIIEAVLS